MIACILYFQYFLHLTFSSFFQQRDEEISENAKAIPEPDGEYLLSILNREEVSFDEVIVFLLALMPHVCPQVLDIFFLINKNFDRPYTEFGGWKGISHGGFLPTGETAVFILTGDDFERRKEVVRLFDKEHWFYKENVLRLEGQGDGEPLLSGQLRVSEEVLNRVFFDRPCKPDFRMGFPAKRVITSLEWRDLVVNYQVASGLEEICTWITHYKVIMEEWGLNRFLKPGYRSLFYGPPGTGKTLAATLIAKRNDMDIYRVDLSMVVSKYIGETEKNLAGIFDLAENRNWILFFDEADALFGKRTSTNTSNDRHSNQEVAYLLQRIEDFSGTVILATNLLSNIDEAFSRRFQSVIYFPLPDKNMRKILWEKMLPQEWIPTGYKELLEQVSVYELSGGSIANVIRGCALQIITQESDILLPEVLINRIKKEMHKDKCI